MAMLEVRDLNVFFGVIQAIKNVSFDDLTIFDFEVGAVGQVECPFTFTDMETMDLI